MRFMKLFERAVENEAEQLRQTTASGLDVREARGTIRVAWSNRVVFVTQARRSVRVTGATSIVLSPPDDELAARNEAAHLASRVARVVRAVPMPAVSGKPAD